MTIPFKTILDPRGGWTGRPWLAEKQALLVSWWLERLVRERLSGSLTRLVYFDEYMSEATHMDGYDYLFDNFVDGEVPGFSFSDYRRFTDKVVGEILQDLHRYVVNDPLMDDDLNYLGDDDYPMDELEDDI